MKSTAERRLQIISVLVERRSETLNNLSIEFGVSKRTIQYDIEVLSCSVPIYSVSGRGGGVRIAEGYSGSRRYLSNSQMTLLKELIVTLHPAQQIIMQGIIKDFSAPAK